MLSGFCSCYLLLCLHWWEFLNIIKNVCVEFKTKLTLHLLIVIVFLVKIPYVLIAFTHWKYFCKKIAIYQSFTVLCSCINISEKRQNNLISINKYNNLNLIDLIV